jgi:hypothetical protein
LAGLKGNHVMTPHLLAKASRRDRRAADRRGTQALADLSIGLALLVWARGRRLRWEESRRAEKEIIEAESRKEDEQSERIVEGLERLIRDEAAG